jgi:serine protease Do
LSARAAGRSVPFFPVVIIGDSISNGSHGAIFPAGRTTPAKPEAAPSGRPETGPKVKEISARPAAFLAGPSTTDCPYLIGDAMTLPLPSGFCVRSLLPRRCCRSLLAALVVAWCLLLCGVESATAGTPRRSPVVEVVEKVRAAVVNIHSERTVRGPANPDLFTLTPSENRINGMGTGVVIDSRGYIVTNQHVVEEVNVIRVRLHDGTTHNASVVARDTESDLALLKIEADRPLPTVPLGTAQDLMVGETVIAIGNAYGYEHTVTVGVVSAVKRDVTLNKDVTYRALIQTDASINPGNSGGPLLNVKGEMVGVNVAIRAGAQGISFAIPVDTMIRVSADMLSARKRAGVWHGLVCRDRVAPVLPTSKVQPAVNEQGADEATALEPVPLKRELVVERIEPESPAAGAGLLAGDVVMQAANLRVACSLDLERAMLDRTAGDHVKVVVRRKGAEQRLDLVLQTAESAGPAPADVVWRKLGLRLKSAAAESVARASQQLHGGLVVMDVAVGGVAGKAGIQRGDILIGLHQWETLTVDNAAFVLNHPDLASFNPLCFYIIRSGQIRRGWFQQVD